MRQTIRLTESDLRAMVQETINEALQDEGFWGNLTAGAKNAFGGDASRIGNSARNMGRTFKQGFQTVKNTANSAVQGVQNAANNMAQGMQKRGAAMKAGWQANSNNDKLNSVVKTLQDLQQKGILHGAKTNQAIQTLIYQIGMLTRGNNSTAAAYRNSI